MLGTRWLVAGGAAVAVAVLVTVGFGLLEQGAATGARGGEDAIWDALPGNAVVAARVVDPAGRVAHLREHRAFGRVLLNPQRFARIEQAVGPTLDRMLAELDGWLELTEPLTREDLFNLIGSSMGLAMLLEDEDTDRPIPILLAWCEPGEQPARRLYRMIDAMGRQEVAEQPLHGRWRLEQTHFTRNGAEFQKWTFTRRDVSIRGDDPQPLNRNGFIVARHQGRLLIAGTPRPVGDEARARRDDGEAVDLATLDALSGVDRLRPMMSDLVSRIDRQAAGGFAERIAAVEGMAEAVPQGRVALQVFADLPAAGRLVGSLLEEYADGPDLLPMVRQLGLDGLGPAMLTAAIEQTTDHVKLFVAMPEPRRGLLTLLEGTGAEAPLPAWVGDDVAAYSHSRLDVPDAWAKVKQLATAAAGDAAVMQLEAMQRHVRELVGAELDDLLGALGGDLHHLSWTARPRRTEDAAEVVGVEEMYLNREAFIVPLRDADPWRPVVSAAAMAFGQLDEVAVEGFAGAYLHDPIFEFEPAVKLFIGHGKLVMTIGPEVADDLLATVARGRAASPLAGHEVIATLRDRLPARPAVHTAYTRLDGRLPADLANAGRQFESALKIIGFLGAMDGGRIKPEPEDTPSGIAIALEIYRALPAFEEVADLAGPGIEQATVTPHGLLVEYIRTWQPARNQGD